MEERVMAGQSNGARHDISTRYWIGGMARSKVLATGLVVVAAFALLIVVGRFAWRRIQAHQVKGQIVSIGGDIRRSLVAPWWTLTIDGIEAVEFCGDHIGDKEIRQAIPILSRLPRLKSLLLCDSRITSASLEELQQLPQLEYVDLSGTQVPLDSVRRLYERMPNLRRIKYVELEVAPGKKVLQIPTS
jgi:hypothetical protein